MRLLVFLLLFASAVGQVPQVKIVTNKERTRKLLQFALDFCSKQFESCQSRGYSSPVCNYNNALCKTSSKTCLAMQEICEDFLQSGQQDPYGSSNCLNGRELCFDKLRVKLDAKLALKTTAKPRTTASKVTPAPKKAVTKSLTTKKVGKHAKKSTAKKAVKFDAKKPSVNTTGTLEPPIANPCAAINVKTVENKNPVAVPKAAKSKHIDAPPKVNPTPSKKRANIQKVAKSTKVPYTKKAKSAVDKKSAKPKPSKAKKSIPTKSNVPTLKDILKTNIPTIATPRHAKPAAKSKQPNKGSFKNQTKKVGCLFELRKTTKSRIAKSAAKHTTPKNILKSKHTPKAVKKPTSKKQKG